MNSITSRFESFELEHSLFDIEIEGVPIWERIRFNVLRQIKRQNGFGQAHTGVTRDWEDYVRGTALFLKNIFINNPYFGDESDILYVGHPRRKLLEDGYWWDIYCDPIHEECNHDYLHLEDAYMLEHYRPARTENLRYLDLINYGGYLQRVLNINEPAIPPEEEGRLQDVSSSIECEFGASVDLLAEVFKVLYVRRTELGLYKRLLQKIDPKLLVIVVSYGKETLIEASKELNIPVVELQHGVIYDQHLGYSYPGSRTKVMFPDYLLTFGQFWKESVEFPIPDDRVIPVGYPYLENSIDKYEDVATRDQILFISQGTIGEQLSKFAIEVNQHPDVEASIVYKLHPGEYDRWEDEYPWLIDADFEIVDVSEPPLYKLFAKSNAQIGVGSTAIYEGLAFGLKTFVYDAPGSEVLQPLVEEGIAPLISTDEDLVASLGQDSSAFDREYYFESKATEKMCRKINEMVESTLYEQIN